MPTYHIKLTISQHDRERHSSATENIEGRCARISPDVSVIAVDSVQQIAQALGFVEEMPLAAGTTTTKIESQETP